MKRADNRKAAHETKRNRESYPMPSSFTNTLIITADDAQPGDSSAPPLLGQDIERAIINWVQKKLDNNERVYT